MKSGSPQDRACKGKVQYQTMKRAARAANHMNDTLVAKNHVVPYHCPFCGMYHVGRSRTNKKHYRYGRRAVTQTDED